MNYESNEWKELVKNLEKTSIHFSKSIKKNFIDFYLYVKQKYPSKKDTESFYRFVFNIVQIPKCAQCSLESSFKYFRSGYNKFCSPKCAQNNKETRSKIEKTCFERFGVNHNFASKQIIENKKKTWLKNLGVDHPSKNEKVKEKIRQTSIKNNGEISGFGSTNYKKAIIKKYGVEYVMHVQSIAEKVFNNKHKKIYILPSGNTVKIQGFEPHALDILLKLFDESDLKIHKDVPTIKYEFENKQKYHYPDFYIPSKNLIIEIKSTYTYKTDFTKNIEKKKAAIKAGFNYEIWIMKQNKHTKSWEVYPG